jgi:hypothetical protein
VRVPDTPRATPGEYTICTAIATEAIFTVRTYATRRGYEPRLMRKFTGLRRQTCTSHLYTRANHDPMIKVSNDSIIAGAAEPLPSSSDPDRAPSQSLIGRTLGAAVRIAADGRCSR